MKSRVALLLAIYLYCFLSRAGTPDECSAAINANVGVMLWLAQVIFAHDVARQFLPQQNCYSVFDTPYQTLELKRKSSSAGFVPAAIEPTAPLPTIILGHNIASNSAISAWLRQPHHQLVCTSMLYSGHNVMDICCLCNRKRPILEPSPDQPPAKSAKKQSCPAPFTPRALEQPSIDTDNPEQCMQID
ncbi:hypothetical protein ACWJJH_21730 [Endozoicomonadaceae bacterium StTr2]